MLTDFVKANPNATVALASGSSLGPLAVWLLSLTGVQVDPLVAPIIGGAVASLILLVGRNGIRGLIRIVWRGSGT